MYPRPPRYLLSKSVCLYSVCMCVCACVYTWTINKPHLKGDRCYICTFSNVHTHTALSDIVKRSLQLKKVHGPKRSVILLSTCYDKLIKILQLLLHVAMNIYEITQDMWLVIPKTHFLPQQVREEKLHHRSRTCVSHVMYTHASLVTYKSNICRSHDA